MELRDELIALGIRMCKLYRYALNSKQYEVDVRRSRAYEFKCSHWTPQNVCVAEKVMTPKKMVE